MPVAFKAEYDLLVEGSDEELRFLAKDYKNRAECLERNRFLAEELKRRGLYEKVFHRIKYTVKNCFEVAMGFETRKKLWSPENNCRGYYDWLNKKRWRDTNKEEKKFIKAERGLAVNPADDVKLLCLAIPDKEEVVTMKQLRSLLQGV